MYILGRPCSHLRKIIHLYVDPHFYFFSFRRICLVDAVGKEKNYY